MITKHHVSPPPCAATSTREDSHAFSLDALRAREVAQPGSAAQGADSSGVIDLDVLRLAGPVSAADDLTTSRLVTGTQPMLPPPPSPPRWAVASLGLLGGAVVALATMIAVGPPRGTEATEDPSPRPTMASATVFDADARVAQGLQIDGAVIPHVTKPVSAPAPAPAPAVEPVPEPKAKPAPRARDTSKARAKTKRASTAKPKATAPTPAPKSEPKPKVQDELSVQCIIDPASCGRGATKPERKAKPKTPSISLPAKLSSSQIRKALAGPKSEAKQCREMHAAPAGTTVKVRLSIAGSGTVRSATAQAPHANSLGRCVAAALGTASFAPFGSPAMGVVYSVRL